MDCGNSALRVHFTRGMWEPRPADTYNQPKGWDQGMAVAETAATIRPQASQTPQMMASAPLTPPSDNDIVPSPRTSPSHTSQQNQENSLPNEAESIENSRTFPKTENVELYKRFQHPLFSSAQEQNNNSLMGAFSSKEHLKSLENMVLPTSSPDDSCSGSENGKTPTSTKQKTYKCKQCAHISYAKVESYRHNKTHMRKDKILICEICEFCTEFKHHFEYHMRNHEGTKPFKCDQCQYSCVNRSMLTSHRKSHSSVYQYRCETCGYSAKYLHALKQHLKKNGHKPGLVLNPDGTPNPYPIIDVYGSRRGPRKAANSQNPTPNPIAVPMVGNGAMFPFTPDHLMAQFILQQLRMQQAQATAFQNGAVRASTPEEISSPPHVQEASDNTPQRPRGFEALDLSSRKSPEIKQEAETEEDEAEQDGEVTEDEEIVPSMCVEANYVECTSPPRGGGLCKHCNIQFGNMIMHQIHMGYHSHGNPLLCNKCGTSFEDSIQFFSHIGMSCKSSQS